MSQMLDRSQVSEVTLRDIFNMCRDSYNDIWRAAENCGRDVKLYLHWSAGRYSQFWNDYHIQVDSDGKLYVPDGITFATRLAGTYYRNSGSIALSVLGCYDATTGDDLGSEPPTPAQLESLYMATCVCADSLDLTIDKNHVMTHGEAGDNEDDIEPHEPYGPKTTVERWDLEYLGTDESPSYNPWDEDLRGGTIIRGKANWYRTYYNQEVYKYFNNSQDQIMSK